MAVTMKTPSPRGTPADEDRGFSLIEAVVSVVVVGLMLAVALSTLGAAARMRTIQAERQDGSGLGQHLMGEILQAPVLDPETPGFIGLEPGETPLTRVDFDDVDDYHMWSASPPQGKDGTPLPGYDGWTRRVRVRPSLLPPSGPGLLEITVTVIDPQDNTTQLYALRSRSSDVQLPPPQETTWVTWAGIELQIGSGPADRVISGVNLLNRAETDTP
jgi:prepilin-type N-terminal cleavage/methylation domain-containing protein